MVLKQLLQRIHKSIRLDAYLDSQKIIPPKDSHINVKEKYLPCDNTPLHEMPSQIASRLPNDLHTNVVPVNDISGCKAF